MREIKFRAWDKKGQIGMIENPKLDVVMEDKRYSLMQFIGEYDEDGAEIYESDICRWDDEEESKVVIIWGVEECCWCYYHWDSIFKDDDKLIFPLMIDKENSGPKNDYECEFIIKNHIKKVLGNIYENPEQLKEVLD